MSDRLGAWSHAPLAYVLAEIRTELIADLADYQPKLAGAYREEYPLQRAMHSVTLVATQSTMRAEAEQDRAWEFATPDNTIAVIIRKNGLVLHATSYKDSADYLLRLLRVVSVFEKIVPSVFVNRLGFRYIDFVLPKKGEQPEKYMDRRLNPDLGLAEQAGTKTTNVAVYPMKRGQLSLRCVRAQGQPKLPPDVGGLALKPSLLMKPLKPVPPDQPTAIIDTDRNMSCSPVELLNPERVHELFVLMRNDIREAFQTAITDHARKVWGAL